MPRTRISWLIVSLFFLHSVSALLTFEGCNCNNGCVKHTDGVDCLGTDFCYRVDAVTNNNIPKRIEGSLCQVSVYDADLVQMVDRLYDGVCASGLVCDFMSKRCVTDTDDYVIDAVNGKTCQDQNTFADDGCKNDQTLDTSNYYHSIYRECLGDTVSDVYGNGFVERYDDTTGVALEFCDSALNDINCNNGDIEGLVNNIDQFTRFLPPLVIAKPAVAAIGADLVLSFNVYDLNTVSMNASGIVDEAGDDPTERYVTGGTWVPTVGGSFSVVDSTLPDQYVALYDIPCCGAGTPGPLTTDCHKTACANAGHLSSLDIYCISDDQDNFPNAGCTWGPTGSLDPKIMNTTADAVDSAMTDSISFQYTDGNTHLTITDLDLINGLSDGTYAMHLVPAAGVFGALNLAIGATVVQDVNAYTTKMRTWRQYIKGDHVVPTITASVTPGFTALMEGDTSDHTIYTNVDITNDATAFLETGYSPTVQYPGLQRPYRFAFKVVENGGTAIATTFDALVADRFKFSDNPYTSPESGLDRTVSYTRYETKYNAQCTNVDGYGGIPGINDATPVTEFETALENLKFAVEDTYHGGLEATDPVATFTVKVCSYNAFSEETDPCLTDANFVALADVEVVINTLDATSVTVTKTYTADTAEGATAAGVATELGLDVALNMGTVKKSTSYALKKLQLQDINNAHAAGQTNATTLGYAGVAIACAGFNAIQTPLQANGYEYIFGSYATGASWPTAVFWGDATYQANGLWDACTVQWPEAGTRPLELKVTATLVDRTPELINGTWSIEEKVIGTHAVTFNPLYVTPTANGITVTAPSNAVVAEAVNVTVPYAWELLVNTDIDTDSSYYVRRRAMDGLQTNPLDQSYGETCSLLAIKSDAPTSGDLYDHLQNIGLDWTQANVLKYFDINGMVQYDSIEAGIVTRLAGESFDTTSDVVYATTDIGARDNDAIKIMPAAHFETIDTAITFTQLVEEVDTTEASTGSPAYAYSTDTFTVKVEPVAPAAPTFTLKATTFAINEGDPLLLKTVIDEITTDSQFATDRPNTVEITLLTPDFHAQLDDVIKTIKWEYRGASTSENEYTDVVTANFVADNALHANTFYGAGGNIVDSLHLKTKAVLGTNGATWDVEVPDADSLAIQMVDAYSAAPELVFSIRVRSSDIHETLSAWSDAQTFTVNAKPDTTRNANAPTIVWAAGTAALLSLQEATTIVELPIEIGYDAKTMDAAKDRHSITISSSGSNFFNLYYWETTNTDLSRPQVNEAADELYTVGGTGHRLTTLSGVQTYEILCKKTNSHTWNVNTTTHLMIDCSDFTGRLFLANAGAHPLEAINTAINVHPWAYEWTSVAGWDKTDLLTVPLASSMPVRLWRIAELGMFSFPTPTTTDTYSFGYAAITGIPMQVKRTGKTEGVASVRVDITGTAALADVANDPWVVSCGSLAGAECLPLTAATGALASVKITWGAGDDNTKIIYLTVTDAYNTNYFVGSDAQSMLEGTITYHATQVGISNPPFLMPGDVTRSITKASVAPFHLNFVTLGTNITPTRNELDDLVEISYDQNQADKPVFNITRGNYDAIKDRTDFGNRRVSFVLTGAFDSSETNGAYYKPLTVNGVDIPETFCGATHECMFNAPGGSAQIYVFEFTEETYEYTFEVWAGEITVDSMSTNVEFYLTPSSNPAGAFAKTACGLPMSMMPVNYDAAVTQVDDGLLTDTDCTFALMNQLTEPSIATVRTLNNYRTDREVKFTVNAVDYQTSGPTTFTITGNMTVLTPAPIKNVNGVYELYIKVPHNGNLHIITVGEGFAAAEFDVTGSGDNALMHLPDCTNLLPSKYQFAGYSDESVIATIYASGSTLVYPTDTNGVFIKYVETADGFDVYKMPYNLDAIAACSQTLPDGSMPSAVTSSMSTNGLYVNNLIKVSVVQYVPYDSSTFAANPFTGSVIKSNSATGREMTSFSALYAINIPKWIEGSMIMITDTDFSTPVVMALNTKPCADSLCHGMTSAQACGLVEMTFVVQANAKVGDHRSYTSIRDGASHVVADSPGWGSLTIDQSETAIKRWTSIDEDVIITEVTVKSECVAVGIADADAFDTLTDKTYALAITKTMGHDPTEDFAVPPAGVVRDAHDIALPMKFNFVASVSHSFSKSELDHTVDMTTQIYQGLDMVKATVVPYGGHFFIVNRVVDTADRSVLSLINDEIAVARMRDEALDYVNTGVANFNLDKLNGAGKTFYQVYSSILPTTLSDGGANSDPTPVATTPITLQRIADWIRTFAYPVSGTGDTRTFSFNGITIKPGALSTYRKAWGDWLNLLFSRVHTWTALTSDGDYDDTKRMTYIGMVTPFDEFTRLVDNGRAADVTAALPTENKFLIAGKTSTITGAWADNYAVQNLDIDLMCSCYTPALRKIHDITDTFASFVDPAYSHMNYGVSVRSNHFQLDVTNSTSGALGLLPGTDILLARGDRMPNVINAGKVDNLIITSRVAIIPCLTACEAPPVARMRALRGVQVDTDYEMHGNGIAHVTRRMTETATELERSYTLTIPASESWSLKELFSVQDTLKLFISIFVVGIVTFSLTFFIMRRMHNKDKDVSPKKKKTTTSNPKSGRTAKDKANAKATESVPLMARINRVRF